MDDRYKLKILILLAEYRVNIEFDPIFFYYDFIDKIQNILQVWLYNLKS